MRQKRHKILLILSLSTLIINCTSTKINSTLIEPNTSIRVYNVSRNAGDLSTAITAVNYLVCYSPDSIRYMDSAANLYYQIYAYNQCIYWCKSSLKHNDSNTYVQLLLSKAYQKNMEHLNAIESYEKLIKIEKKPEYYLHLAECQYLSKRLLECIQTTLNADSIPLNYKIKYLYKDTSNKTCSSNFRSALLNYRGLAHFELGNVDAAIQCFSKALEFDSNFLLSQYNLQVAQKKKMQLLKNQD
ncbi:MAG TPA: tetratricopeptide repeat protein [Bacteroidia bacterium]